GRETKFNNTAADQASVIWSPEGRITQQGFEEKDLLVYRDDINGVTILDYDNEFKKVSSIRDDMDHFAYFTYAENGELATSIDKRNLTTSFSYNEANLLSTITDSLGHQQHFTYNEQFELASISDELGNLTVFGRDL